MHQPPPCSQTSAPTGSTAVGQYARAGSAAAPSGRAITTSSTRETGSSAPPRRIAVWT